MNSLHRAHIFFAGLAIVLVGCQVGNLRGREIPSSDGQTYLVIEDNNGGQCGPILVDGKKWPYPLHVAGPISPGLHKVECGTQVEIEVQSGSSFHFDYWGP
jgi:hypothetical protein